jgi:hypothetical protein
MSLFLFFYASQKKPFAFLTTEEKHNIFDQYVECNDTAKMDLSSLHQVLESFYNEVSDKQIMASWEALTERERTIYRKEMERGQYAMIQIDTETKTEAMSASFLH